MSIALWTRLPRCFESCRWRRNCEERIQRCSGILGCVGEIVDSDSTLDKEKTLNRLDGKIALITGGARGNGAATAELFVEAGATVIISDVLDGVGEATAERLGSACAFMHHDVTSPDDWSSVVASIVERHGGVDVLVNNAGIFKLGGVFDSSLDDWNSIVAINQTGVFLGMQAVAATMKANGSGSIINISSIAGLVGTGACLAYGASKWAVRGMTKAVAVELASSGVRANSVHPGIIATDMLHDLGSEMAEVQTAKIPLGRLGAADDVGRLVLFLASDDSAYCTGHEFVIDGALTS